MTKEIVMVIEKPYLTVKLHERLLEVDFADGLMSELEGALEANTGLRETLGYLLQAAIPLDVALSEIESATVDEKGHVKVAIPFRKDLIIPLGSNDSRRLVERLNQLVPAEKARAAREMQESEARKLALEETRARAQADTLRRSTRTTTPR